MTNPINSIRKSLAGIDGLTYLFDGMMETFKVDFVIREKGFDFLPADSYTYCEALVNKSGECYIKSENRIVPLTFDIFFEAFWQVIIDNPATYANFCMDEASEDDFVILLQHILEKTQSIN